MRIATGSVFGVLAILLGSSVFAPASALENVDCKGSPEGAVMTLPEPLAKWGRISCTPFGHVLTSHLGWIWVSPARQPVFVPSQLVDGQPERVGNAIYFTKIEAAPVKGNEFDKAYAIFHAGFDSEESKPDGYRIELTSSLGKSMEMYFFDYDSYAWGIWCPDHECNAKTRFMILNRYRHPHAPEPSI